MHRHAERPHVHALTVHASSERLRSDVRQGAAHVLRAFARHERLGESEIHERDGIEVVRSREDEVLELEVAMHHAPRVHERDGVEHVGHDDFRVALLVRAVFHDGVHELLSLEKLHHHVHHAVGFEGFARLSRPPRHPRRTRASPLT